MSEGNKKRDFKNKTPKMRNLDSFRSSFALFLKIMFYGISKKAKGVYYICNVGTSKEHIYNKVIRFITAIEL